MHDHARTKAVHATTRTKLRDKNDNSRGSYRALRIAVVALFLSHTLLTRRFKQHNCYRCSQIQAASSMHRDCDATVSVGRE